MSLPAGGDFSLALLVSIAFSSSGWAKLDAEQDALKGPHTWLAGSGEVMTTTVLKEAAEVVNLLLHAAFGHREGVSRRHAFVFGPPHRPSAFFNTGAEVFYSEVDLAKAALVLRERGAFYLRSLPLGELEAN